MKVVYPMHINNDGKFVHMDYDESLMILNAWRVYYATFLRSNPMYKRKVEYIREVLHQYSETDAMFQCDELSGIFDSLFDSDSVKLRDKRFLIYLDRRAVNDYDIESILDLVNI